MLYQIMFSTFKRFIEPVKESPLMFIKATFLPCVSALFTVFLAWFIKNVTRYAEAGDTDMILHYVYIFIVVLRAYIIVYLITRPWQRMIFSTGIDRLTAKYLRKYIRLDNNYAEKMGTGKMIEAVQSGTQSRLSLLRELLVKTFASVITLTSSLILLYSMRPTYMYIFLGFICLSFIGGYFGSKVGARYRKLRKKSTMSHKRSVVRILMSKFEIFYNDKIDVELSKLSEYAKEWLFYDKKITYGYYGTQLVPRILLHSMRIGIVFMFVYSWWGVKIEIHELVGILSLFYVCEKVIEDNIDIVETITKHMVNITKLWEVLDDKYMNAYNYSKGEQFILQNGDIKLDSITFTYASGKNIFNDFHLAIQGGKKTALVGGSGSGKTTIIKLIAGYIRPDKGDIIIDNQNLSDISLKSYYKHIGYLTQEPSVFDGTVRENLEYGMSSSVGTHGNASDSYDVIARNGAERNDEAIGNNVNQIAMSEQNGFPTSSQGHDETASQGQLDKIISLAKCERIYNLPKGLDTQIGEKGIMLSGGQRQRLAIAKIMMKNPEIILLDEPTSALDSLTEHEITQALNNLFQGRTVIVVAHRLQTVKHADEIIVLGEGENGAQVLERGTHDELVGKGGFYSEMLELQSGF